jgi:23S rRNA pseudouridine1911/1915/1917 synthase
MTTQKLTADRAGERADALLARLVPDLTRSAAQKLLERGDTGGQAGAEK